ncbi:MAG: hypothetical protein ACYC5M_13810 [Anaerolineae bacterium]
MASMLWKKGRGKLGPLAPLIGEWIAEATSPEGLVRCTRRFERVLGGTYVRLEALWEYGDTRYEELALIGRDADGQVRFWSFTSDGKQSSGVLADVTDIHPQAVGFEAQMDAGLARMAYWPDEQEGFRWVVESHSAKGWKRFVEHHYLPATEGPTAG